MCYLLLTSLDFLSYVTLKLTHFFARLASSVLCLFEHMSVLQCIFRKIIQLTRTAAELYYVLIRIVLYYVLFLYYVLCNPDNLCNFEYKMNRFEH